MRKIATRRWPIPLDVPLLIGASLIALRFRERRPPPVSGFHAL